MTNQSTIDKLIEMRLTTMADAFRNQLDLLKIPFTTNRCCGLASVMETSHLLPTP